MKFNPQDAIDNPGFSLLEPGIYPFQVLEAKDDRSSNGNDLIKLKLQIGSDGHVYDNLVAHPKMTWRIKHFFFACGIGEHFTSGSIAAKNCHGKTGMCQIDIEPAKGNNKARNVVADYLTEDKIEGARSLVAKSAGNELAPSDLPF